MEESSLAATAREACAAANAAQAKAKALAWSSGEGKVAWRTYRELRAISEKKFAAYDKERTAATVAARRRS